eukprot:CAMPEP_0116137876 /NCGR_PEP_ID=MMETSP0329-20121206/12475_1 /TAXON_ID=697910 /ORGANISM="Pseudo-nitzschia arenysensis, Strain B593" /LENGTH=87 /DNA_ID=CAMNT_0003632807 /DNA_START=92 /DNA_END=355 /DNA_ORIENTATION=-
MSKKHKKKARAAKIKPHTVKEANRRKRLRDNLKSKRASTKTKQSSKNTSTTTTIVGADTETTDTKHPSDKSSTIEDSTSHQVPTPDE